MEYIDYYGLEEFYTISDLCKLFGMEKKNLRFYCERYSVEPERVGGVYGFSRHMVRHLHNLIYKEENYRGKASERNNDPWA